MCYKFFYVLVDISAEDMHDDVTVALFCNYSRMRFSGRTFGAFDTYLSRSKSWSIFCSV